MAFEICIQTNDSGSSISNYLESVYFDAIHYATIVPQTQITVEALVSTQENDLQGQECYIKIRNGNLNESLSG
jgi:hypothetical protein